MPTADSLHSRAANVLIRKSTCQHYTQTNKARCDRCCERRKQGLEIENNRWRPTCVVTKKRRYPSLGAKENWSQLGEGRGAGRAFRMRERDEQGS